MATLVIGFMFLFIGLTSMYTGANLGIFVSIVGFLGVCKGIGILIKLKRLISDPVRRVFLNIGLIAIIGIFVHEYLPPSRVDLVSELVEDTVSMESIDFEFSGLGKEVLSLAPNNVLMLYDNALKTYSLAHTILSQGDILEKELLTKYEAEIIGLKNNFYDIYDSMQTTIYLALIPMFCILILLLDLIIGIARKEYKFDREIQSRVEEEG